MKETAGTRILTGEPEKAIPILAAPLAIAIFVTNLNTLVDITWISWLGAVEVSGVSLVFPLYAALVGLGTGLGVGVAAAVARQVGARNHEAASRSAGQIFLLAALFSIALSPPLVIFAEPLMEAFGAGEATSEAVAYAVPLCSTLFLLLLSQMISGLLRGEGATRQAMYVQVAGAVTNLVLDPILIFGLGWGVAGAAWATVAASAVPVVIGLWLYRGKGGLYASLAFRYWGVDLPAQKSILVVGAPQAAELVLMSVFNIPANRCIIEVGGLVLVGIYTAAWRVAYMVLIPAQAFAGALVPVCSAETGANKLHLLKRAFGFAVRKTNLYTVILCAALFLLSSPIASVLTVSEDLAGMHGECVNLLMVMSVMLPFMAMVFVGGAFLQSRQRAMAAFGSSFLRNVVMVITYGMAAALATGAWGIWISLAFTDMSGGLLMYWLAKREVRRAVSEASPCGNC